MSATGGAATGSNYTATDLTSAIETGYDIFSDAEEFNDIDFFANVTRSSFAILDSGYKYIYDKYNQKYRFVPCAADVAGLCISTTINSETWFSPAGYNRGNLRNATKLAYSPKQSERDRLYNSAINPIVSFPGQGIVLFGDKTSLNSTSAFGRINVRRLFIEIERNVARFAKFQLFEINDEVTRSSFKSAVEPYLRGVQGRRGIYNFLVVCDETNNTPDVIDRNEFNAEIYIQPARSINFITITFVATRTGISFGELTQ
jgi:phage tail sheath protein FI